MGVITLQNDRIYLRMLEPQDLQFLSKVENNPEFWTISQTTQPFTNYTLSQYIEQAHQDIYESKQQRWVICQQQTSTIIGFIDLFDFDIRNSRVGLGIVIADKNDRKKGYATDSLELILSYIFNHLFIRQIFVNILTDNTASIKLFSKFGFQLAGVKKDWIRENNLYKDEAIYQLIRKDL